MIPIRWEKQEDNDKLEKGWLVTTSGFFPGNTELDPTAYSRNFLLCRSKSWVVSNKFEGDRTPIKSMKAEIKLTKARLKRQKIEKYDLVEKWDIYKPVRSLGGHPYFSKPLPLP